MPARTKPTPLQRIHYICGAALPDALTGWVVDDLTGPGATRRYLLRFLLPVVPPLCLFLLLPGPLWMHAAMMGLLYIPIVYFAIALVYVYRRHRLVQHGLDPDLADTAQRQRRADDRLTYERRYGRPLGPTPESPAATRRLTLP